MARRRSRAWLQEHAADPHVKEAWRQGLRSRAAFKLSQIDDRDRLFAGRRAVLDLGAAPGGWSQVAARRAAGARVVAVDLLEMHPLIGVTVIRGDFREAAVIDAVRSALPAGRAGLVLSDMAPNLTGVRATDIARAEALAEEAAEMAIEVLEPGGDFLCKTFQGPGTPALRARLALAFARVATRKPDASRARSSELYLLARGLSA